MPAISKTSLLESKDDVVKGSQAGLIERAVARQLRIGVLVSVSVITCGLVISFVQDVRLRSSSEYKKTVLNGHFPFPHSFVSLFHGVINFRGDSICVLGILCLLLTPASLVACACLAYLAQGDRSYVVISGIVLCVLVLSFVLGGFSL